MLVFSTEKRRGFFARSSGAAANSTLPRAAGPDAASFWPCGPAWSRTLCSPLPSPAAKMFCATGIADAHESGVTNNIHLCPAGIVPGGSGWVARAAGLQAKRKRDHPFLRRKDGRVLSRHTISRERSFRGISNPRQTVSQLSVATEGKKEKAGQETKCLRPACCFAYFKKSGVGSTRPQSSSDTWPSE